MILKAFIVLLIISSYSIQACDCSPVSAYEKNISLAYVNSDVVMLGTVKLEMGKAVVIDVLEVYKGDIKSDTVIVKILSSCSEYFKTGETWLFYLDETSHGLTSDQCMPNRPFRKMNILSFPPPLKDSGMAEAPYLHSILLYQELISLRQKKLLDREKERPVYRFSGSGFKWVLIIGLCINILLVFLLFRRK